jgi:hypothetical protein
VKSKKLILKNLKHFILDECDKMLAELDMRRDVQVRTRIKIWNLDTSVLDPDLIGYADQEPNPEMIKEANTGEKEEVHVFEEVNVFTWGQGTDVCLWNLKRFWLLLRTYKKKTLIPVLLYKSGSRWGPYGLDPEFGSCCGCGSVPNLQWL